MMSPEEEHNYGFDTSLREFSIRSLLQPYLFTMTLDDMVTFI